MTDPTTRNHTVYSDASTTEEYAGDGWLCAGEMRTFRELADLARGARLLDLGVGAGRTTGLLSLITSDYVGVDFSAAMIAKATARHPYADLRVGDARELKGFSQGEFGALVFSFNGLDTLGHDERARAFSEMHRVLRPGGVLTYSIANKDGPEFRSRPWHGLRPPRRIGLLLPYLRRLRYAVRSLRPWWQTSRLAEDHGDWALGTVGAHRYRLLVHYVTFPEAQRELRAAGFEPLLVVNLDGREIDLGHRNDEEYGAFIVARKAT